MIRLLSQHTEREDVHHQKNDPDYEHQPTGAKTLDLVRPCGQELAIRRVHCPHRPKMRCVLCCSTRASLANFTSYVVDHWRPAPHPHANRTVGATDLERICPMVDRIDAVSLEVVQRGPWTDERSLSARDNDRVADLGSSITIEVLPGCCDRREDPRPLRAGSGLRCDLGEIISHRPRGKHTAFKPVVAGADDTR